VQPYAIAYVDEDGRYHASVDYVGETTFVRSFFHILSGPPVRAQLSCLAPIATENGQRRELALAAREAIGVALGAPAGAAPSHASSAGT
jgi:1-acyl-sn-glycerol-3-phosphate acyltransferase